MVYLRAPETRYGTKMVLPNNLNGFVHSSPISWNAEESINFSPPLSRRVFSITQSYSDLISSGKKKLVFFLLFVVRVRENIVRPVFFKSQVFKPNGTYTRSDEHTFYDVIRIGRPRSINSTRLVSRLLQFQCPN